MTTQRQATRKRKNALVSEHLRLVVNILERDPTPQEQKKYIKSVRDFLQWSSRWTPDEPPKAEKANER